MRLAIWGLVIGMLLALAGVAADFPVTVTDARGVTVTVTQAPARIISLAPSLTETLFALGAGSRVVAVTNFCNYPPAVTKLPRVGGFTDPSIEKIIALQPNLVLANRGVSRQVVDRLTALKITTVCIDPQTLPEAIDSIRLVGKLTGLRAHAETVAKGMAARRAQVLARTHILSAADRPMTLFLFAIDNLYSVGPGSALDALITDAGGRNVGASATTPWPQLSLERVITADPAVILVLAGPKHLTTTQALQTLRADRRWQGLRAVKSGRVFTLDDDLVTRPGPRMADGLQTIALALHPALFPHHRTGPRKGSR